MGRISDFETCPEVGDIMEAFIERWPHVFEGFDVDGIHVVKSQRKSKFLIKLHAVGFPNYIFGERPYIVEVYADRWDDATPKQKNIAVFHAMCGVPDGGFDEQSKNYGKKLPPDINMYMNEFVACGGIPDWMYNSEAAKDPMEIGEEEIDGEDAIPEEEDDEEARVPVTVDDIANVGLDEGEESKPQEEEKEEGAETEEVTA